jgi:hypothetical protein
MRYYFDLNGAEDLTGTELSSPDAVPREALSLILAVAADKPEAVHDLNLTVRNQQQRPVYTASLRLEGQWQDREAVPR